jgi:hypothetical protein
MRGWIAALTLLAAVPGAAQPPAPAPLPPAALAPNEGARTAFEALASNALTDEMIGTMIEQALGGNTGPIDDVIERGLAPGELVPGWQASGIDLLPLVAARDGGLAGNMAEGIGQFGADRFYFVDRPIESLVSPQWVLVGRRGAAFSGENVQVGFAHVSPKVILAARVAYRRQGNAYCRTRTESRLYADPAVAASQLDWIALVMAMRSLAAVERRGLCEVVEEAGPGLYRTRLFDEQGHRLPGAEGPDTFRIVPRLAPAAPR